MRKYRLIAKKGEGTFSEVIKAQNIKNSKFVAIKCMRNVRTWRLLPDVSRDVCPSCPYHQLPSTKPACRNSKALTK